MIFKSYRNINKSYIVNFEFNIVILENKLLWLKFLLIDVVIYIYIINIRVNINNNKKLEPEY